MKFVEGRPMGIGQITCCVPSCSYPMGVIFGTRRGLYHIADIQARPRRVRKWPVAYVFSGPEGAICYEEASGTGRLAILDANLEEIKTDVSLARRINPRAYCAGELIIHHQGDFVLLDPLSGRRRTLCRFVPTRSISPFVQVDGEFDFIAIKRGPHWPTDLYRMSFSADGEKAEVTQVAQAEEPIFARHILRLPNGQYIVAPRGEPVLEIYRIFEGGVPGLRMWTLVPIPEEAHPVGMVRVKDQMYVAAADGVMIFELSDDLMKS